MECFENYMMLRHALNVLTCKGSDSDSDTDLDLAGSPGKSPQCVRLVRSERVSSLGPLTKKSDSKYELPNNVP